MTDCLHIENSGLPIPSKDLDIWNYAKGNDFIIVTMDEDFLDMINIFGFPPKVVLLRTGQSAND